MWLVMRKRTNTHKLTEYHSNAYRTHKCDVVENEKARKGRQVVLRIYMSGCTGVVLRREVFELCNIGSFITSCTLFSSENRCLLKMTPLINEFLVPLLIVQLTVQRSDKFVTQQQQSLSTHVAKPHHWTFLMHCTNPRVFGKNLSRSNVCLPSGRISPVYARGEKSINNSIHHSNEVSKSDDEL